MGKWHIKSIQTLGQTLGNNTVIRDIKEHKIFVAISEALQWKHAYFQFFDRTFIERAIVPPSDGSGPILNHSSIRSDIKATQALWPLKSTKFLFPPLRPDSGNMLIFKCLTVPLWKQL